MTRLPCIAAFFLALGLAAASGLAEEPQLARRWLYLQQNLQVTDNAPKLDALLRRVEKGGYDGVVLVDYK